jgi:hypothetical protein
MILSVETKPYNPISGKKKHPKLVDSVVHRIGLDPTAALHYATIKSAIKGFYIKDKKANTYASQEQHQAA